MSDAGEYEEERLGGLLALTQRLGDTEFIGEVLEREEHTEDQAAGGGTGKTIEFAFEGSTQGIDPCWLPMRQVGQGKVFNFSIFAISLAQENGGWGITIRHGRDIHADYSILISIYYQYINVIYMTTVRTHGYNFRLTFSALMVFATGRSVCGQRLAGDGRVGVRRNPPRYLKVGDVVRVEIERIGYLENPVIEKPADTVRL